MPHKMRFVQDKLRMFRDKSRVFRVGEAHLQPVASPPRHVDGVFRHVEPPPQAGDAPPRPVEAHL